ncbi:hypothetical protein FBU30_000754 [Linnemannia zychae]|nr:hypothetical protein FBU30_000754 [Linnemannia zychae]
MPVKTTTLATEPALIQQHELNITTTAGQSLSATVLTYGATLTHLICPDRWSQPQDVVLGFDHWEDYLAQAQPGALNPYFGSIIGPTASRIANATFQLDSTHYDTSNSNITLTTPTTPTPTATHVLQVSNGLDCHHGGLKGFDKQHWITINIDQDETSIMLERISPHGEYGYPGRLVTQVQYQLTVQGELVIEFKAQVQEDVEKKTRVQNISSMDLHSTIVSLTNHAYWNLDGVLNPSEDNFKQLQSLLEMSSTIVSDRTGNDKENVVVIKNPCTIKDHTLWLSTSTLIELGDKHPVPTGVLFDVIKTPELHVQKELLDFTSTTTAAEAASHSASKNKPLEHGLDLIPGGYGYDHVFALNGVDAIHPTPTPVNEVGIQGYWPRTPHVATLYSPRSGIRLDLSTSEPAIVLYSAGYLDKSLRRTKSKTFILPSDLSIISPTAPFSAVGGDSNSSRKIKIEAELDKFAGFCLEPIRYPDAIHHRDWAQMVILHHDQTYRQRSIYKFSSE